MCWQVGITYQTAHAVAGTQLQLPQATTRSQLQTLLNQILKNEEPLPYAFYIDDVELADEIGASMVKNKVSVERVVQVLYQPQAVFRVRPVARCSATMEGEFIPPHLCAPALQVLTTLHTHVCGSTHVCSKRSLSRVCIASLHHSFTCQTSRLIFFCAGIIVRFSCPACAGHG